MATIFIDIVGVAIGYVKWGVWYIIFPVDRPMEGAPRCHNVIFKAEKNGQVVKEVPLADKSLIEIEIDPADGANPPQIFPAEPSFLRDIYDLTSRRYRTHPGIRQKPSPERFVLMRIPNAYFSVRGYVPNRTPLGKIRFPLREKGPHFPHHSFEDLAHSGRAIIDLKPNARVKVKVDHADFFATDPNEPYTLTINNDCKFFTGNNDMEMYYDVIEEFDAVTGASPRRFLLGLNLFGSGGISSKDIQAMGGPIKVFKDPPDAASFLAGNTCLFSQVSDDESIDKLPPFPEAERAESNGEESK